MMDKSYKVIVVIHGSEEVFYDGKDQDKVNNFYHGCVIEFLGVPNCYVKVVDGKGEEVATNRKD